MKTLILAALFMQDAPKPPTLTDAQKLKLSQALNEALFADAEAARAAKQREAIIAAYEKLKAEALKAIKAPEGCAIDERQEVKCPEPKK